MSLVRHFLARAAFLNRGSANAAMMADAGCSGAQTFCTFTCQWTEMEYEKRSEETLAALNEYLDALPERVDTDPAFDISYSMGVLTAHIGAGRGTYVINKQKPNKQIWLSSPISGPKRYDLSDSGRWIYRHDGQSLHELLEREFRLIYGGTDKIHLTNLP